MIGTEPPALAVRIDAKHYPNPVAAHPVPVLSGLNFSTPAGEFLCLVGPSGSGKTTLLNILAGIDRDFTGMIAVRPDGQEPGAIGIMFQNPRLMPWLSVLDNVLLVVPAAVPRAVAAERARHLLAGMGLADMINAFPGQLSGGMQRRVALARAFVVEPELLLLDEPFVSLDQPVAHLLRQTLLDLWQQRPTTVVFVTHDLREAMELGDRILFLSAGPGRVVLDLPIDLPRPRTADGPAIEGLRRRILAHHPLLLAGLTGTAPATAARA